MTDPFAPRDDRPAPDAAARTGAAASAVDDMHALVAAFDGSPIGIAHLGVDGTVLHLTRALRALLGVTDPAPRGRTLVEFAPDVELAHALAGVVRQVGTDGVRWAGSLPHRGVDGRLAVLQIAVERAISDAGAPFVTATVVESPAMPGTSDEVLERVGDAHVTLDAGLRYVSVNPAAARSMGRERGALLGRPLVEAFPDARGSRSERAYRAVSTTGVEAHFVEHYVGDGLDAHVEVDAYPVGEGPPFGVSVFWRDVTGRVTAEAAQRASEARFRAVFEQAAIGIGLVSFADARWLHVNDALCRLLGRSREELHATPWPDITHPDDVDVDLVPFRRMAAGELETYTVEKRFVRPDGHHVHARLALALVRDAAGRPDYEIAIVEDVTARTVAEAERERLVASLEVERARLEEVFRRSPSFAVVYRGPEHRYEFVNDAYYQLIGHRAVLGHPLDAVVPEAREQGFAALLDRVLATGEAIDFRETPVQLERVPGAPRELRYVDMVFQPLAEADGRITGVLAQGVDITAHVLARRDVERLLAEAEAARAAEDLERRWLEAVLAAIPVGVVIAAAPSGSVRYANTAMAALWGGAAYTRRAEDYSAEWHGLHVEDGQPTARRYASHEWPVARVLATGTPVLDEDIVAVRPDGTRRMVRISAAPVRDAAGTMVGVVATVVDIEATFQAQRLLDDARQAAETANLAKSDFLASMSHELRTPLNAIQGHVQLIELGLHGAVTEAQRAALARVGRAQQHLLGLINDVLNYAKLEAAQVAYHLEPVGLGVVLADVAAMMAPDFAARGLALSVHAPPADAPWATAWADAEKLRQVLLNLLSNAAKFTPAGGTVALEAAPEGAGVAVRVRDTGIGIPRDKLEAIFAPFVQVHAPGRDAYTRTHEGTGLGLAISRDLARGMGGDLSVTSAPGMGSTFTILLRRPAAAAPEAAPVASAGAGGRGGRRSGRERRSDRDRRARGGPDGAAP